MRKRTETETRIAELERVYTLEAHRAVRLARRFPSATLEARAAFAVSAVIGSSSGSPVEAAARIGITSDELLVALTERS